MVNFVICILTKELFEDDEVHHVFRMVDMNRRVEFCKDAEIHTLELPKFQTTVEQVETPIQRWCYFLTHAAAMDPKAPPKQLETPAIIRAMEVLMRIRENEQDRQAYITKRINEADTALREYAHLHAHEIGLTEGRIERIHSLQRISKQPLTPKEELETLPLSDLTAIGDRLEQQVSGQNGTP